MMIVEMHRIPKPLEGYDLFDCPGPHWHGLRKLGERYGWQPAGTCPSSHHGAAKAEAEERRLAELRAEMPQDWKEQVRQLNLAAKREGKLFDMNKGFNMSMRYSQLDLYEPRDWGGVWRMVTTEDGVAWASALDRACADLEALNVDLPQEGPVVINTNMHEELNEVMNHGLSRAFIRDFANYIRQGSFGFVWDD